MPAGRHSVQLLEDVQAGAAAKTGDMNSPGAYKPICLLNEVGKLFERIVLNRLTEHLQRPDLHGQQYGFRPGKSTIDAINRLKCIVEETTRRNGLALAVSVDIINAFNTIFNTFALEGERRGTYQA